jgi:hypothetical protein
MTDFDVIDHGTMWAVFANYESSAAELGGETQLIGDWRPMWHFCQHLHAEGFTFKCNSKTAQNLIETGKPW